MTAAPQIRAAEPRLGTGANAPQLRPYQLEAIAAVERELATHRSTLLVQATGTGKTVVFADLTRRFKSRGIRTLILAHRDELIGQAMRKLEAVGIDADVEQGKRRASTMARVVIASVQTLRGARLERWPIDHFGAVITDEAHHSPALGYRAIYDRFVEAKLVGVTATPLRADGKGLGEVYETVAFRYEIREAIRAGYLVPIFARQVIVDAVDLSGIATRAGDLAQDQLAAVMESERAIAGTVLPLLELTGARPTVVFGVDVAHATLLAARINAIRPGAARAVSGETSDDDRRRLLEAFEAGEFQFLCNCALLTEGWDAPSVECVAMARPTKSWGLFVQCVGRGMRPSPATGKRDLLVLQLTGRPGKHRLIGPADCLAGSELGASAIADDLAAEVNRLLGTQQLDLEQVIESADVEVGRRRAELAKDAIARFHTECVDPFVGPDPRTSVGAPPQMELGWATRAATVAQLAALDKQGVTLSKLPPGFLMADASRLLARLSDRRRAGLCSLAQAKAIAPSGIPTAALGFDRARELCQLLRHGSWRPQALRGTPEYIAAANARPHDLHRLGAPQDSPETGHGESESDVHAPGPGPQWAEHEALP